MTGKRTVKQTHVYTRIYIYVSACVYAYPRLDRPQERLVGILSIRRSFLLCVRLPCVSRGVAARSRVKTQQRGGRASSALNWKTSKKPFVKSPRIRAEPRWKVSTRTSDFAEWFALLGRARDGRARMRKNRRERRLESCAVSDQRPRSSTRGELSCLPGRNYNTSGPPRAVGLPPFATTTNAPATTHRLATARRTDTPSPSPSA